MNASGENGTVAALSPKQQRFLMALLTEKSTDEAVRVAGIGKTTGYKYLADPVFKDALRGIELTALNETTRALIRLRVKATDSLESVFDDILSSPSARIRAAEVAIGLALKLRETIDHEERISQLEARLNISQGGS